MSTQTHPNRCARRMVVLHHRVGAASRRWIDPSQSVVIDDHFDWMFEIDPGGLLTVATAVSINRSSVTAADWIRADWLPDHRRRYLDYQGEIGGDRGTVQRIASAAIVDVVICQSDEATLLRFDLAGWHSRRLPTIVSIEVRFTNDASLDHADHCHRDSVRTAVRLRGWNETNS